MMPRKKRITIIILIIMLILAIAVGMFAYIYLKTDILKSDEEKFIKYFSQSFNYIENLSQEGLNKEIQTDLQQNKYESDLTAKIDYTQNLNTTSENKDSSVNNLQFQLARQVDKQNDYNYNEAKLVKDDEDYIGVEYFVQNSEKYMRYFGIKQYLKLEDNESNQESLKTIEEVSNINFSDFKFTDEEKESLKNEYLKLIQQNLNKNNFGKQQNAIITIDSQSLTVNEYYLKATSEQYNNMEIASLEFIKNNKIILSKIDELVQTSGTSKDLKQTFIDNIDESIESLNSEEIKTTEIKITVYESNYELKRITVEEPEYKIVFDFKNDNIVTIKYIDANNENNIQTLQIQRIVSESEDQVICEYKKTEENTSKSKIILTFDQTKINSTITRKLILGIENETSNVELNILNKINLVNEFTENIENRITGNMIDMSSLNQENKDYIMNLITDDTMDKFGKIDIEDYLSMISDLVKPFQTNETPNIIENSTISETEKNRFNSNFEFFEGEKLNYINVEDLMGYVKNNLNSIDIILEDNQTEKFDYQKINEMNDEKIKDYISKVVGFKFTIVKNENNIEASNKIIELVELMKIKKFNVKMLYDDNGLVNEIDVNIVEE